MTRHLFTVGIALTTSLLAACGQPSSASTSTSASTQAASSTTISSSASSGSSSSESPHEPPIATMPPANTGATVPLDLTLTLGGQSTHLTAAQKAPNSCGVSQGSFGASLFTTAPVGYNITLATGTASGTATVNANDPNNQTSADVAIQKNPSDTPTNLLATTGTITVNSDGRSGSVNVDLFGGTGEAGHLSGTFTC